LPALIRFIDDSVVALPRLGVP